MCNIVKLHTHTLILTCIRISPKDTQFTLAHYKDLVLLWRVHCSGRAQQGDAWRWLKLAACCTLHRWSLFIFRLWPILTSLAFCFFITLSFCFCQCYPCSHPCSDWAGALSLPGTLCFWMWRPQRTDVPMSSPTAWRAPSRRWCRCWASWRRVAERRNSPPKFWCDLATQRLGWVERLFWGNAVAIRIWWILDDCVRQQGIQIQIRE